MDSGQWAMGWPDKDLYVACPRSVRMCHFLSPLFFDVVALGHLYYTDRHNEEK